MNISLGGLSIEGFFMRGELLAEGQNFSSAQYGLQAIHRCRSQPVIKNEFEKYVARSFNRTRLHNFNAARCRRNLIQDIEIACCP